MSSQARPRDAWAMAEAVRAGEVTSEQLVEEALARIAELDPEINAFTVLPTDLARQAARAADRRRAQGGPLPPLLGVPVSVKDHIWLAGVPATNGSAALADFVPTWTPCLWRGSEPQARSWWARPTTRSSATAATPTTTCGD